MLIKPFTDLQISENRASSDADKQRALLHAKHRYEMEKEQAVNEAKRKQWCTSCQNEGLLYCCWNTSYCSVLCQVSEIMFLLCWHTLFVHVKYKNFVQYKRYYSMSAGKLLELGWLLRGESCYYPPSAGQLTTHLCCTRFACRCVGYKLTSYPSSLPIHLRVRAHAIGLLFVPNVKVLVAFYVSWPHKVYNNEFVLPKVL